MYEYEIMNLINGEIDIILGDSLEDAMERNDLHL